MLCCAFSTLWTGTVRMRDSKTGRRCSRKAGYSVTGEGDEKERKRGGGEVRKGE